MKNLVRAWTQIDHSASRHAREWCKPSLAAVSGIIEELKRRGRTVLSPRCCNFDRLPSRDHEFIDRTTHGSTHRADTSSLRVNAKGATSHNNDDDALRVTGRIKADACYSGCRTHS